MTSTTPHIEPINEEIIRQYLNFLSGTEDYHTFCFMDEESRYPLDKALACVHGNADKGIQVLTNLWKGGTCSTMHVLINRAKVGRKKKDIESARVLLLDLDTPRNNEELAAICREMHPQMVVQSSPGKFHLYWAIDSGVPFETWEMLQLALAHRFDGDLMLRNRTAQIRVPGVPRKCKDGTQFTPSIISIVENPGVLHHNAILKTWPWVFEESQKARERIKREAIEIQKQIKAVLEHQGNGHIKINVGDGKRNNTLYYAVRQWVINGVNEATMEEAKVFGDTINGAFKTPLEEGEVVRTVRSGWENGCEGRREREAYITEVDAERRARVTFNYKLDALPLIEFPFAERGVMERVAQRFQHLLLNVNGDVWACNPNTMLWSLQTKDAPTIFTHFIEACIDDTMNDSGLVDYCTKPEQTPAELQSAIMALRMRFQKPNFSEAILRKMLQQIPGSGRFKKAPSDIFDAHDLEIHVQNGMLHLWNAEVRDAAPGDYLTLQAPVMWNENAECPKFIRRLRDTFPDKMTVEENVRFHVVLIWYCMTALTTQQKVFLCTGTGANGKSSYFNVIRMLLGDYCGILQSGSIATQQGGFKKDMERLLVSVENKRTLLADDLETKVIVNEGVLKNLTGKHLSAKPLYKEQRLFTNRAKFLLGCNDLPKPESESEAVLRRFCISEFTEKFRIRPELEKQFEEETQEELSGILAYAIWAARESVTEKGYGSLPYTQAQKTALDEYRSEHFVLGDRILEVFEPVEEVAGNEISAFAVREELRRVWGNTMEVPSARKLFEVMERVGVKSTDKKKAGYRFYYVKRKGF